jgi:hypothetical protein
VVASDSGLEDNSILNPLLTPLAKSLHLEWYLTIDGQYTGILGETLSWNSKVTSETARIHRVFSQQSAEFFA